MADTMKDIPAHHRNWYRPKRTLESETLSFWVWGEDIRLRRNRKGEWLLIAPDLYQYLTELQARLILMMSRKEMKQWVKKQRFENPTEPDTN